MADERYKIRIGYLGGSGDVEVYYSKKLGIWFAFRRLSNRYWNPFGLGKPSLQRSNGIVVEINFPIAGIDKRIAGCFIRDNDRVLVYHRGRIGGGRPGVGFKTFWNQYTGERIKINDEDFALIGDIDSEDFPERVKDFVIEVNRIKDYMIDSEDFSQPKEEESEEKALALSIERDIQNYIVSNPDSLEKGLKVYGKDDLRSVQDSRYILLDNNSKIFRAWTILEVHDIREFYFSKNKDKLMSGLSVL